MATVLVTGCFDLLHPGHIKFLRFAASTATNLIVGLESDDYISSHKGPTRPIFSQLNRKLILSEFKSIKKIILLKPNQNYLLLLKKIHPDFLVITSGDHYQKEKAALCHQLGIRLIIFPKINSLSTSTIVSRIASNPHS
jgi:cytidyltransferase-like protein